MIFVAILRRHVFGNFFKDFGRVQLSATFLFSVRKRRHISRQAGLVGKED
jgi:hypothetical protein